MQREQWASRYGFILASIGGAVGLGNLWRFPYVAGESGGAVFLFLYIACVLLIGLPLMIAELSIGRRSQGDAVTAFKAGSKPGAWSLVGWVGVIVAALILSYLAEDMQK